MKINDRVKVDFISESRTEFSGKHFTGEGVVDRIEDGRVFGRLDNGAPFVCGVSDATVIEQQDKRKEYEAFFEKQLFYLQLKYIHGDRLFDFDQGIGYRNLTVQIGYVCWCKGDHEFALDALEDQTEVNILCRHIFQEATAWGDKARTLVCQNCSTMVEVPFYALNVELTQKTED